MKHRILQLLLCTVFAVALLSAPVAAATDGDYEYSVDSGNATITGYTGSATNLTIPSTLGGYPVTVIGDYAFMEDAGLTSITIPDSVTYIGYEAFYGCTGLTSVTIPDSITYIGWDAFDGCTGLNAINVDISNSSYKSIDGALFSKDGTVLVAYPGGKAGAYTIPDNVTEIGEHAFSGCTGLTSVTIGGSVTDIGYAAFYDCTGLTSITIPDSVTKIGSFAFDGCTGLTAFNVDSNNISYKSVDGVIFSKDGTKLVLYPVGKTGSYTVSDSVTEIGYYAFYGCTGLTSVIIGNSVTEIDNWAFSDCTGLTSVTIGDSVTNIGNRAFEGCTSLTSINVDSNNISYKSVDGVLFSKDGTNLIQCPGGKTGVYTIPNSVTDIGDSAFYGCTGLIAVTIPNSVTDIGLGVFNGCAGLTSINVDSSNSIYESLDGVLFSKDGTKLIQYPGGKGGAYSIPDSVTNIDSYAFRDCSGLTSVTIPNSVTDIGYEAFYGCTGLTAINVDSNNSSYKSIDGVLYSKDVTRLIFCPQGKVGSLIIPSSVTVISGLAIVECSKLTAIAILNPNTEITTGAKDPSIDSCPNITIYCDDPSTGKDCAIALGVPYKPLSEFPGGLTATGVTLNKDKLSLIIGNTGTLTATVAPDNASNKNVTWSSDQTSVATVDGNGKVTAKAAGTANITVKTEDGNFTASCAVTVVAAATFSDVPKDAWYYPYVTDLASTGIINGKGGGIFDPNGTIKRCEFAKILAIASGDDLRDYNGQTKFGDVSRNAWYATYVQWANENGIVNGKNATAFAPEDKISRQEMAVMIKRYADYKKITLPKTNAAITFADDSSIASWAKEAVSAMQQAGIINGKGGNVFDPLGNATRGEAAKMISVFLAIK